MIDALRAENSLSRIALRTAGPLKISETITIQNPNDIDHWLAGALRAGKDQEPMVLHEALLYAQSLDPADQLDFGDAINHFIEEEYGSREEFVSRLTPEQQRQLRGDIAALKSMSAESQTPPEQATEQFVDAAYHMINRSKNGEQITVEDSETVLKSLAQDIRQFPAKSDREVVDTLYTLSALNQLSTDGQPELEHTRQTILKEVADHAQVLCERTVGSFDPEHEDSFLVDASKLLAQTFDASLPFLSAEERQHLTEALNLHITEIEKHFLFKSYAYRDMVRFIAKLSAPGEQMVAQLYIKYGKTNFDQSLYDISFLFTTNKYQQLDSDRAVADATLNELLYDGDLRRSVDLNILLETYRWTGLSRTMDHDNDHSFRITLRNNLHAIRELEQSSPGATKYLFEERGIRHFSRYPVSLLEQQYKERDQVPANGYITLLMPEADHNWAFQSHKEFEHLAKMAAEQGIGLRLAEAGSARQVLGQLNRLTRKYGKSAGGFFGAHGSPKDMEWGNGDNGVVSIQDLAGSGKLSESALHKFFDSNATLVLISCSTGVDEGMAQELSRLGVRVFAPAVDTNITEDGLKVRRRRKRIEIDVEYLEADVKRVFEPQRGLKSALARIWRGLKPR